MSVNGLNITAVKTELGNDDSAGAPTAITINGGANGINVQNTQLILVDNTTLVTTGALNLGVVNHDSRTLGTNNDGEGFEILSVTGPASSITLHGDYNAGAFNTGSSPLKTANGAGGANGIDINTNGGAVTMEGKITLDSSLSIQAGAGNVSVGGAVDAVAGDSDSESLNITTTGTQRINGPVGQNTPLGSLTNSGSQLHVPNNVTVTDSISLQGGINTSADTTLTIQNVSASGSFFTLGGDATGANGNTLKVNVGTGANVKTIAQGKMSTSAASPVLLNAVTKEVKLNSALSLQDLFTPSQIISLPNNVIETSIIPQILASKLGTNTYRIAGLNNAVLSEIQNGVFVLVGVSDGTIIVSNPIDVTTVLPNLFDTQVQPASAVSSAVNNDVFAQQTSSKILRSQQSLSSSNISSVNSAPQQTSVSGSSVNVPTENSSLGVTQQEADSNQQNVGLSEDDLISSNGDVNLKLENSGSVLQIDSKKGGQQNVKATVTSLINKIITTLGI